MTDRPITRRDFLNSGMLGARAALLVSAAPTRAAGARPALMGSQELGEDW